MAKRLCSEDRLQSARLYIDSFQRFLGIKDSGKVPDRNTVWTFREKLVQAGLGAALFDEVNRQLQAHGYLARCGQIIDATLVPVPIQRKGEIGDRPRFMVYFSSELTYSNVLCHVAPVFIYPVSHCI
ncbi:hypothetical protein IGB42_02339 [Andreprevotia sp. IGB-42]|uniref:transposase n=1 Tax=Andreprevotia sp. IGB-42 TaxID=2497473 RepID=UPI0013586692|nr:transposase [Andreprevotia sp. IGB-42]KAF0813410.1 hypothetical protein IGB42_02339 [Andreprevotia sp. IGB-42]